MELRNSSEDGKALWRSSRLTVKECRVVQMEVDLLGIHLCGGDIANARCEIDSKLKKEVANLNFENFDLPEESNPFEATYHYHVSMIHPGGELNLFARSHELERLD